MKILFIYPKYPETFWSFKHVLKFVSRKAAFPPLGLMTISSMMPKDWKKKLIDLNVEKLKDSDIKWADMVFVSAMLVQKKSAQEAINKVKSFGKKVVVGGPAFTTQHESFRNVDHFVLNEGEITFPLFLEDLKNNKLKKMYTSEERPDITKTPIPDWKLIKRKNYGSMTVQYSRGCPFNCEFCDIIIMNGRIPRTKSPSQMIKEFDSLYNSGWRGGVFVVDDNFIGNKKSVKEFLPHLIRWQEKYKYPFTLTTEASVNLSDDDELMHLMSKANFSKVFLGIETPNEESLKECGKFQNTKSSLAESVRKIHRNGMQVMAGFIVGFDNDNENIFERQIKFIKEVGIVTAMVGTLIALPRTRLWNRLKEEGRLIGESSGENTDSGINFIPKLGIERLKKGYKEIIKNIYSSKEYYARVRIFLKDYKPTSKGRFKFEYIKAFFRSVIHIGIFSKSAFRYWNLIIRTMFTNFKALSVAIELSIYGVHYEKFMKRIIRN